MYNSSALNKDINDATFTNALYDMLSMSLNEYVSQWLACDFKWFNVVSYTSYTQVKRYTLCLFSHRHTHIIKFDISKSWRRNIGGKRGTPHRTKFTSNNAIELKTSICCSNNLSLRKIYLSKIAQTLNINTSFGWFPQTIAIGLFVRNGPIRETLLRVLSVNDYYLRDRIAATQPTTRMY